MTLFRFKEARDSRRLTTVPVTQTNVFTASGSNDPAYVRSYALAATPAIVATEHGLIYRQDVVVDPVGFEQFRVTVPYAARSQDVNAMRVAFDTTGGTVHITSSKETIASYPAGAPDHKQLIGVDKDDVKGESIVIPALKLVVYYRHPPAVITLPQIKHLASVTGKVNSEEFLTWPAGEVLFLGAAGSEGPENEVEVAYHFAMSENTTGLSIGDIADIAKKGHEYVWIKYADTVDDGRPAKVPEFAYVERVYDTTDLSLALGFG